MIIHSLFLALPRLSKGYLVNEAQCTRRSAVSNDLLFVLTAVNECQAAAECSAVKNSSCLCWSISWQVFLYQQQWSLLTTADSYPGHFLAAIYFLHDFFFFGVEAPFRKGQFDFSVKLRLLSAWQVSPLTWAAAYVDTYVDTKSYQADSLSCN